VRRTGTGTALLLVAAVVAGVLVMRAGDASPERTPAPEAPRAATPAPSPTAQRRRRPPRARCPRDVPGCVAVRGRVVYVERVDPDGDGDLHVVLLAGRVTAPGVTAVDVAKELRPRRDPRIGDVVAAAGPVQRGHLGQAQIHAVVFEVR
jgi:hypothetical protein